MAALQREQLNRLCSTPETFEKAQSILRLANAKTRPGSGFSVKNPIAIPAVCAYIASEQLNTGEVSLQSAMSAACVSKTEFSDILKKVRDALSSEQGATVADVTYGSLVDAYRVHSKAHAVACMEDAEAVLPQVDVLKDKYGETVVSCAVFYWVCQLMEEPSVQQRSLCQAYSMHPKTFKAVVAILDTRCDGIADQIKSHLKSPMKTPSRPRVMTRGVAVLATSPTKKRADHRVPFPETPTKKRRIDSASPTKAGSSVSPAKRSSAATTAAFHAALKGNPTLSETPTKERRTDSASPTKAGTSVPLAKRSSAAATAAFHAALKGSPTKLPTAQGSDSPVAGPSTPRRPRHVKVAEDAGMPVETTQATPSRSQGQMSPTHPSIRRRFRPVFLDQQQWCTRDPKVERMWAAAEAFRDRMVELHGHPFESFVR